MPGKNSNFDPTKDGLLDRWLRQKAHIYVGSLIMIFQLIGMYRCYYFFEDRRYSLESQIFTFICIFCDIQIYKGLYTMSYSDPGYCLPENDQPNKEFEQSCEKCDYKREHERIHHCSRCNRCVSHMDHHCYFTDNCVGRDNYRYFVHFCIWMILANFIGSSQLFRHIYTYN